MDKPPLTGHDFLILSTQDWDALPTRKHRFARWWAEDGNRVLYVEQQMHWAGWLADVRNQFSRAWRWLGPPRAGGAGWWSASTCWRPRSWSSLAGRRSPVMKIA